LSKEFQCLVAFSMFHISHNHGSPSDHIACGHLVEYSPSLLHAPTFGIHVNEAIAHKDIRLTVAFKDLLMKKPPFFKCLYI